MNTPNQTNYHHANQRPDTSNFTTNPGLIIISARHNRPPSHAHAHAHAHAHGISNNIRFLEKEDKSIIPHLTIKVKR